MAEKNTTVAICNTHEEAEQAIKQLQKSGYDMAKLSIIGKDYHTEEEVVGYYNNGERMNKWGRLGAFWGGFWGLLFGSAFFIIPGIGPIAAAGPVVSTIVGGLEGAVVIGGLSAIGAGLFGLGIPKDSIIQYETALKSDKFLVIAHGSPEEVARAKEILDPIENVDVATHHS